jgi:drug/metabolite transporter (DMT)-like permease
VAVLFYHNSLGIYKIAGIAIALVSVVLSSQKEKTPESISSNKRNAFLLPLVVFIGSGVIDAFVNYGQEKLVAVADSGLFLAGCFGVAGCIGIVVVSSRIVRGQDRFDPKSILGGIALAIPNYFSIYCMLKALNSHVMQSSVLYPINNMGIVLLCAAGSFLLFKERFSKINLLGIVLSVLAIALISQA